ncbi:MAG: PaaI family thioesterase [Candidatus Nanopelagicales bacterium]|nr:PaaI family thioesterase [Candidatus Nanopelagicales bacterium]
MRSTHAPVGSLLPERLPSAPEPGSPIPSHYRWCFGCGSDHPTGLHMRITAGAGLRVIGNFRVTEHHQGAPGLAHGGLLSAAIDEVLGSLNWLLGEPVVTASLSMDFLRPVPVGSVLHIEAEVTGVARRKVYTSAVGRLDDAGGDIAVSASALFMQVPIAHFMKFGNKEQVELAIADRASGGPSWRTGGHDVEVNP